MSSIVLVNDAESEGVIDDWMAQDSTAVDTNDTYTEDNVAIAAADAKMGLGFLNSAQSNGKRKGEAGGLSHAGAMHKIQKKEDARKKGIKDKREAKAKDLAPESMHGLVENDIEESRTTIVTMKNKMPSSKSGILPGGSKRPKQQQKQLQKQGHGKGPAIKSSTGVVITTSLKTAESRVSVDLSKTENELGQAEPVDAAGMVEDLEQKSAQPTATEQPKRKKTKTRSKQKNIRKDNRPDIHKPAYLLPGNREYKGRPLTDQTKLILGIETKPIGV